MDDTELLSAFEACTIDPGAFGHQTHVRVAWLYLRQSSAAEALAKMSAGLRRLSRSIGREAMYHETVTAAFVFLINERMERGGRDLGWNEFEARNGDLFDRERPILHRYYRPETLRSDLARSIFVMPDRIEGEAAAGEVASKE
jgi:hypothetical protein